MFKYCLVAKKIGIFNRIKKQIAYLDQIYCRSYYSLCNNRVLIGKPTFSWHNLNFFSAQRKSFGTLQHVVHSSLLGSFNIFILQTHIGSNLLKILFAGPFQLGFTNFQSRILNLTSFQCSSLFLVHIKGSSITYVVSVGGSPKDDLLQTLINKKGNRF